MQEEKLGSSQVHGTEGRLCLTEGRRSLEPGTCPDLFGV